MKRQSKTLRVRQEKPSWSTEKSFTSSQPVDLIGVGFSFKPQLVQGCHALGKASPSCPRSLPQVLQGPVPGHEGSGHPGVFSLTGGRLLDSRSRIESGTSFAGMTTLLFFR